MYKQKINKILIGTNNKGKLREIKSLLPKKIKIYSTSTFNLKSPVENGKTFKENSLIKSKYFSKKTGLLCLADDSGLEIDFLNKKKMTIHGNGKSYRYYLSVHDFCDGLIKIIQK